MTIALTPKQKRWLEQAVAAGRFTSVEEAVDAALTGLMTSDEAPDDWVKPPLDQARGDVARGASLSLEEFKAQPAARRRKRSA